MEDEDRGFYSKRLYEEPKLRKQNSLNYNEWEQETTLVPNLEIIKSKRGKVIAIVSEGIELNKSMESKRVLLRRYNESSQSREFSSEDKIFEGKIKRVIGRKMLIILPKEVYLPLGKYSTCSSKDSC